MTILGIETSCDETAVSVVRASGGHKRDAQESLKFDVLSNLVLSQVKLHEKYGGVFPNLAKREHTKNIIPLLKAALTEVGFLKELTPHLKSKHEPGQEVLKKVSKILEREHG